MKKHTYTLGSFRTALFRVLDEYSLNGNNTERFSGMLSDIEKRLVSSLNMSIRRIYLSSERLPKKASLFFAAEKLLAEYSDMSMDCEKKIFLPENSSFFVAEYSGEAKLSFFDMDERLISETLLTSEFGNIKTEKALVPESCVYVSFAPVSGFFIKKLRFCGGSFAQDTDPALLPDGNRLFCRFDEELIEIISAEKESKGISPEAICYDEHIISVPREYQGYITIEYYAYPDSFTESTPDDTPIPLSPAYSDAALFMVAADLCDREDDGLYSKLTYKYREILNNTYPIERTKIRNRFFSTGRRKSIRRFWG